MSANGRRSLASVDQSELLSIGALCVTEPRGARTLHKCARHRAPTDGVKLSHRNSEENLKYEISRNIPSLSLSLYATTKFNTNLFSS